MSALFPIDRGFATFFAVQRSDIDRGPYGYAGPFITIEEAEAARVKLSASQPAYTFRLAQCGLCEEAAFNIDDEYRVTMARFAA